MERPSFIVWINFYRKSIRLYIELNSSIISHSRQGYIIKLLFVVGDIDSITSKVLKYTVTVHIYSNGRHSCPSLPTIVRGRGWESIVLTLQKLYYLLRKVWKLWYNALRRSCFDRFVADKSWMGQNVNGCRIRQREIEAVSANGANTFYKLPPTRVCVHAAFFAGSQSAVDFLR